LKPSRKVVERSTSRSYAMRSVKVVGNMAPNVIVIARVKVQVIEKIDLEGMLLSLRPMK
jgi:hypothetical protein